MDSENRAASWASVECRIPSWPRPGSWRASTPTARWVTPATLPVTSRGAAIAVGAGLFLLTRSSASYPTAIGTLKVN